MGDLDIMIGYEEWMDVWSIVRFLDPDERAPLGLLQLAADGTTRRWWASDGRQAATVEGQADARTYDVRISPRMVLLALLDAEPGDPAVLSRAEGDAGPELTLAARSGTVTLPLDLRAAAGTAEAMAARSGLPSAATFRASAGLMAGLLRSVQWPPVADTDDLEPPFILSVDAAGLTVRVEWSGVGPSQWTLEGEATGEGYLAVPPEQLEAALRDFEGDVTLDFAGDLTQPLMLYGEGRSVLIMPLGTRLEQQRQATEALVEGTFGPDALLRDADGDYPLPAAATPIFARLIPDDPIRLVVFAVVLADVGRDDELMGELNDHNSRLAFVRTFWIDGSVIVEADLIAATTDRDELVTAFERVRDAADELGPMLAALYGGSLAAGVAEERWDGYRRTAVWVEAGLDEWVELIGPTAAPWTHDAVVHLLTAANPHGSGRSETVNAEANLALAGDLLAAGCVIRQAVGREFDAATGAVSGGEPEHGFLVVGLSREDALALGRRHSQEAIFEVEGDEARVLACFKDRAEAMPRRHGGRHA